MSENKTSYPPRTDATAFKAGRDYPTNSKEATEQELTTRSPTQGLASHPLKQTNNSTEQPQHMGITIKENDEAAAPATDGPSRVLDPTTWPPTGVRLAYRDYLAEFWGTFVLIFMGVGVVATSKVNDTMGGYLGITFGWGAAVTMGLYVSLGISGGHINPSVTFANAVWGRFPWRKVPGYILAQVLGAFVGAAGSYALFGEQLRRKLGSDAFGPNGYAGVFSTYPMEGNSIWTSMWSEFIGTMLLLLVVCGIFDEKNAPAKGHGPIAVGLLVFAIGITSGCVTGYAINPARDFGPRVFSAMIFGSVVFTRENYYFLVPLLVPFLGATVGVFLYLYFIPHAKEAAKKDVKDE